MKQTFLSLIIFIYISSTFAQHDFIADTLIIIPLGKTNIAFQNTNQQYKKVSAGYDHFNLVLDNNTVVSYQDTSNHALTFPDITDKIIDIQTGAIHSLILFDDSTISQFMTTDEINMFFPWKLKKIREIRCGLNMSLALKQNNIMYTWGSDGLISELGIPPKTYGVKTASIGEKHVAFINIKNKVFVWGDDLFEKNKIPTFKNIPQQIVSGNNHVLVLDNKEKIYCWGKLNSTHLPNYMDSLKIKNISAKGDFNLVTTYDNQVVIWNENNDLKLELKNIGDIKFSTLGIDFAVIGLKKKQSDKNKKTVISQLSTYKNNNWRNDNDSLNNDSIGNVQSFLSKYFLKELEDTNSLVFKSINSKYYLNNSNTEYEFQGKGNKVTVINDNMDFSHNNNYRRVIFKGSGKNYVIRQSNQSSKLQNDTSTIIIDLAKLGYDKKYSQVYSEAEVSPTSENSINYEEIFIEINPENFEVTSLSYTPIHNGYYDFDDYGAVDETNYELIAEYASYFPDGIEKARALFYTQKKQKAFQTLLNCTKEGFDSSCPLALFELYYYGLFDTQVNVEKAKYYLSKYEEIIKSYDE